MSQGKLSEPPKFTAAEFEHRIERTRKVMTDQKLDGLLVTSEFNYRYLTGFTSQFWRSPTRPWYFVLPREGEPLVIIPDQGVENMERTSWVKQMRTWPSPRPENEGIDLVVDALRNCKGRFGRIGAEIGKESRIGITVADFLRIRDGISPLTIADCEGVVRQVRMVKSPAEVARIRHVCQIVCDGYDALAKNVRRGDTEADIIRKLHVDLISRGAHKSPYLIGVTGPGGYPDAIMGPTDRVVEPGDVLIIDTGTTYDGYYCDFNRNWAFGTATDAAKRAYKLCYAATEAGMAALRPGARASDLYRAQAKILEDSAIGFVGTRMGHGLGVQLTETPSNMLGDDTILEAGMVMTIEPGLFYGPRQLMLHEENLVVTEHGAELLTRRATEELQVYPF
jgi:Xaa-Pro dipeptidase